LEQQRHDDCHGAVDLRDHAGERPIGFLGAAPPATVWVRAALCGVLLCAAQAACSRPPTRIADRPPAPPEGGAPDGGIPDGGARAVTTWVWSVRCPAGHDPTDPIDYGRCAIDQALAEAHAAWPVVVTTVDDPIARAVRAALAPLVDQRPESYVIAAIAGTTWVVGRDAVGAMYGALQVAERLRLEGATALPPSAPLRGAPGMSFRGANLFWVLPEMGESAWWFLDEDFWRDYLDLLAHARLNVLDLHGMYDLGSTIFPNALLYLARSVSFPNVGAPPADRDRNLAMLNRVIAMARARGIRVGLMTYSATADLGGAAGTMADADLQTYVREAAADVAARVPGLAMMGFRTGESGRPASWYADTFVNGVRQVAPAMTLATRTWGSSKTEILSLASSIGSNMVVEAKFNAEHLGPPYAIAGGAMAGWASYSYQDYLNPPHPWTFVFQVRAGGSHQIFREASYGRTQRAITALAFSPAVAGFTLEPPTAYTPQRDYYHASATDQFSRWAFARDDLMYLEWGRLGYDPNEPEAHFRQILAREAGTDALWPSVQAASDIVPWILAGRTCGPDSRNFEPEMELGGDVGQWAGFAGGPRAVPSCDGAAPFDTFAIASPDEAAADLVAGVPTSRVTPADIASFVLNDAALAAQASAEPAASALARDVARECWALADLGRYFGHKLQGATALAVYERVGGADWLDSARAAVKAAGDGWRALAADTAYIRPFPERLRMAPLGYDPFHWSREVSALDLDAAALDAAASSTNTFQTFTGVLPSPSIWIGAPRPAPPVMADLTVSPADPNAPSWTVRARFARPLEDAVVNVLWKPFASETDWKAVPAIRDTDGSFGATVDGGGAGALFAVEVRTSAGAWRLPDPSAAMPYVPLAP
jgi:hypothetical protein